MSTTPEAAITCEKNGCTEPALPNAQYCAEHVCGEGGVCHRVKGHKRPCRLEPRVQS